MKLSEVYRQKFEAQVEELSAHLALMRAKAKRLAADAKIVAHEELADTEKKLTELKAQLVKVRASGGDAWTDMKGGLESAWADLNKAAKQAKKRFDAKPPRARSK